ncbi:hypothetical protein MRB53_018976 [Persea americana]|uniref:Uncharacterized protein n=1 Tax=Persea americana TaxID=3435 RepID=A0ACC2M916_PERAE|nr:hypothetical protein MRB53_018976 [Persea americana]
MGICYSRLERQEAVARCKARRRYMKQLVKVRRGLMEAHTSYLQSLRGTGAALLQFGNAQSHLCLQHHAPPCPTTLPPPPGSQPMSSCSADTWTSPSPRVPPASPPPSSWNFWDPFAPFPSRSATREELDAATAASQATVAPAVADVVVEEPSVVSGCSKDAAIEPETAVSMNSKDLAEIMKEIDEHFVKAADAGSHVSFLLGAPSSAFPNQRANKVHNCSKGWNPLLGSCGANSKLSGSSGVGKLGEEMKGGNVVNRSHRSTIESLYAWEKKLHKEVKNAESIKIDHEKKVAQLKKQEAKGAEHMKIEKSKKEIEKLENRILVSAQSIETISEEIIRLREAELYPQLLDLVNGLMCMWKSMYECHQVQTNAVQQLKFLLNNMSATEPTSKTHYKSTLQLEFEVQQWHSAFCNLINSQRDYIRSLTGWLRLSLFQLNHHPSNKTQQSSSIYPLSEEFQLALDRIPDKVASEGIKSFLTVIHATALQQGEEQKQKKRMEAAFKELEEKVAALQYLECKNGPHSKTDNLGSGKLQNTRDKRAEVDNLRAKAKEEKIKYEKCMNTVRVINLNNLQTEFPNMFQAMTSFSSLCVESFESVHNKLKSSDQGDDLKDSQSEKGTGG